MRSALLVLSLIDGTVAFAQSSPARPVDSFKLELTPPSITQLKLSFSSPRKDLHIANAQLWKDFANSRQITLPRNADAQIDPGMIVRPPKSSIGVQPPGTPIAQNLYPGLRLLPIDESRKLEEIPAEWPNLNLQNIPINRPKYKNVPATGDSERP
jgi:hypothetical protein